MPDPQYYKTQGADGKWYTTQASSPEEAQRKFAPVKQQTQTSLGSRTATGAATQKFLETPQNQLPKNYGFTAKNVARNVYEGAKGVVQGTYEMGKDALSNPNWFRDMPAGQRPSTMQKFVYQPADAQMAKAKDDLRNKRLLEAAGHAGAAMIPVLGPAAASIGEQAGTGDVGGALGKTVGMVGTGVASAKVADVAGDFVDPAALRQRAAELNTKVLKTAEGGMRDKTAAGLQVAKEQIVSNARNLPAKIEAARSAKNTQVQALAQAADKAGITVDVSKEVAPIVRDVASVANQRGTWTPQLRSQINSLMQRVTTQLDMRTGQTVPRDLSKLSVTQALQLEKGLEDLSAFGKQAPDAINNLARRLRGALNDKLPPNIQRLRGEESKLIVARDAADKTLASILNDNHRAMKGLIYSGAGPIAVYMGIKALGGGFMTAIGSVVILRALAQSTASRTLRAALYARAADLLDTAQSAPSGPTGGPSAALQRGLPSGGPVAPQGPQAVAGQGLTPQNRLAAPPAQLPAAPQRVAPVPTTPLESRSVPITTRVAPSNTVAAPKTSGVSIRDKAMMDRLDELEFRTPKSGAERNAITREREEIKKILKGEDVGTKNAGAPKRIADRERLASKRAASAVTSGAQSEPAASVNPEMRAIALDAGYKKLATYEGGTNMVKTLRATAKAMQKVDPTYDEVEALTLGLQALQQLYKGEQ